METKDFIDGLEKCFDGTASPEEQAAVVAAARSSAVQADLLRQMVRMNCYLATLRFSESNFVEGVMSEITRKGSAETMAHAARLRIEAEIKPKTVADFLIRSRSWRRVLALAASLAIVAGGVWWVSQ
ncbi:MAG: hypothetical protein NTZ28_03930, partial [Nitrospirae bacterium]|nr:hypothetical protein [Nitrospirota bacterium]